MGPLSLWPPWGQSQVWHQFWSLCLPNLAGQQPRSLPQQMNSGNTTILAFCVNPTNALAISLTGCPSYSHVGAKALGGGCDEGITERTPRRTEPSLLQLCRYAAYLRGHQQRLVLNTNSWHRGNRGRRPPTPRVGQATLPVSLWKRKQIKREICRDGGLEVISS